MGHLRLTRGMDERLSALTGMGRGRGASAWTVGFVPSPRKPTSTGPGTSEEVYVGLGHGIDETLSALVRCGPGRGGLAGTVGLARTGQLFFENSTVCR